MAKLDAGMGRIVQRDILPQINMLCASAGDIALALNRAEYKHLHAEGDAKALDKTYLALLASIDRFGPTSVSDLAGLVGRHHGPVSRRLKNLEKLGLIERRICGGDKRSNEAKITDAGRRLQSSILAEQRAIAEAVLHSWDIVDIDRLVILVGKFADSV